MVENIGNGLAKVGVSQEDLEESIAGLRQLKPILQKQVMIGNGHDTKQGLKDAAELGKHFDTAIDAMCMLLSGFMGVINRRSGMVFEFNGQMWDTDKPAWYIKRRSEYVGCELKHFRELGQARIISINLDYKTRKVTRISLRTGVEIRGRNGFEHSRALCVEEGKNTEVFAKKSDAKRKLEELS